VDLNEAKTNLESADIAKIKDAVAFLKDNGDAESISALRRVKSTIPIFETNLLQQIDSSIFEIGRRNAPAQTEAAPAAQPAETPAPQPADTPSEQPASTEQPAAAQGEPQENPDQQGAAPNGNNGSEYPQNEYLEKVKDIWEKGKKNANIIMLRSKLISIKNDKLLQLKHLGEKTYEFYKDNPPAVEFISSQIAKVREIEAQISKKQADKQEMEEYKAEGGFWNIFKASLSKMMGYTKIKLDISIFQSNRESKLSAFGQMLYDKLAECEQYLKSSPEVAGILDTIADLEEQRKETEDDISKLSQ